MAPPPCGAEAEEEPTLLQYFASCGLSSRVLDLADAIFANDYGADMSDVRRRYALQPHHLDWRQEESLF